MPRRGAQRADRHRRRARPRCRRPFARRSRRSFLRFAIAGRDAGVIVLVTRPLEQSQALAERLLARGHQALLFPLLRIEPIGDASTLLSPALEGAQAILFTSVNGVRASPPLRHGAICPSSRWASRPRRLRPKQASTRS